MAWLRRHWRWLSIPAFTALAALAGWFPETGDFLVMPGGAFNTGEMVRVATASPRPHQGSLLLLTVYSSPANVDMWVFGHVYPHARLLPAHTQLPPHTSYERFKHIEEAQMANSQTIAKVVALRQLGYDVPEHGQGVLVSRVQRGTSAEAAGLSRGDLVLSANGQLLETGAQLIDLVARERPGARLDLLLKRNNSDTELDVPVLLGARPNNPNKAFLGVEPATYRPRYEFPFDIEIDSKGIIGPSAGLVLTLAIMQAAGPTDITHGHSVAATGTIALDGGVGPIGGIEDKVLAAEGRAEYLLVPRADYDAARAAAHRLKVAPVDNIGEALDFLATLA